MAASDDVILLDEAREPIGRMPRSEVHTADTPLHLAYSVYVFDDAGRLLVTRRALGKLTWPGVWSNSCCGHVRPGETPAEAALRRTEEELGFVPQQLRCVLPDFAYRATSAEGIVEHEVCPVFVARFDGAPSPDPAEVAQWAWVDWRTFVAVATDAPDLISPWAALQAPLVAAALEGSSAGG
ncbi:MAG: isopentenyl-diphosphate Delta-isomerase [Jatrophihabitans sp.]|uniref:isopentenyl-diphosphate Delta-isomerase n=1 Tax=Jatrophihabitans sp. TaxID=1932789 RepID=UPI003F816C87